MILLNSLQYYGTKGGWRQGVKEQEIYGGPRDVNEDDFSWAVGKNFSYKLNIRHD